MKRLLPKSIAGKRFDLLNSIGFEYRYSYPDSTIFYCSEAYELGKSLKLSKQLSKPLSFMGLANANKGDYKKSLEYHYQSIEIAIQQNDSVQLAFAYNNLGRMFIDQGDQERAYDNLVRSKDLFEKVQDRSGLAYIYRSLASLFKSQKDYSRAIEMSARSLEIRKKIGNPRDLASAYLELGLVYQAMNEPETALLKFAMADSVAGSIDDKVTRAEISLGLAEILLQRGKYDEAFQIANKVLQAISDSTNRKLFLRSSLIRGKVYFKNGNDAQAIPILEDIVSDVKNSNTPYFQEAACKVLYEIYQRRHDTIRAKEYLSKYKALDEMLNLQALTNHVERLQFQVDIEKKDRENALLKANQSKNEAVIANQRSQNTLLVITVIFIAGLALVLWRASQRRKMINKKLALQNQQIYYQREEITRQNERLSQRNSQLSELNNEKNTLMNIVAHDLKTPVNQIRALTELIEPTLMSQPQADYLRMIKQATRSGLDMITDLLDVNELEETGSNPEYQLFELNGFLEQKIKSFQVVSEAKDIQISLTHTVPGKIRTDANYVSRILDNLLSNAIKFSRKGSFISVSTELLNDCLLLKVKDQGPGFSGEDKGLMFQKFKKLSARPTGGESSNGLGLAIVKILVDRLGGTIELLTQQGVGSEFTVTIPDRKE